MGKGIYYLLLLLIVYDAVSQDTSRREVEFILNGGLGSKGNISPVEGHHPVQSAHLPAFQIGIDYRYPLKGKLSISYGLRLGMIGSNLSTDYPLQEISPEYAAGPMTIKNKEYVFLISLPVSVQYQFQTEKPTSFHIQGGLKLNYSFMSGSYGIGYVFSMPSGEQILAFDQSTTLNNNKFPWISLLFGTGIRWRMKNSGPIRTGILADISFSKVVRGTYAVVIPGQQDTFGDFNNHLSSLSLVVGYGLHGREKKVERKFSSNSSDKNENRELFNKTHYSLAFNALYCFPAKVKTVSGESLMGANAVPGLSIAGNISFHINKNYSIVSGIQVSAIGRNISLQIDKTRYTPNLEESINLHGMNSFVPDLMVSLPLGIEKRWFLKKGPYVSFNTGVILNYFTGPDYEYQEVFGINENKQSVSVATITASPFSKVSCNAFLNLGYNIPLKNNNIGRLSILSNIAFSSYLEGEFTINDSDKIISTGTYTASANYIGLGFTYIYTRSRHN